MKIDNIYIVDLVIIISKDINYNKETLTATSTYSLQFLKKALVYEKKESDISGYNFMDLKTGRKYEKYGERACHSVGDIVIYPKNGIIPFRRFLNELNKESDVNIKFKNNMTKRKILSIFK